jgi:hypothetical protein
MSCAGRRQRGAVAVGDRRSRRTPHKGTFPYRRKNSHEQSTHWKPESCAGKLPLGPGRRSNGRDDFCWPVRDGLSHTRCRRSSERNAQTKADGCFRARSSVRFLRFRIARRRPGTCRVRNGSKTTSRFPSLLPWGERGQIRNLFRDYS